MDITSADKLMHDLHTVVDDQKFNELLHWNSL